MLKCFVPSQSFLTRSHYAASGDGWVIYDHPEDYPDYYVARQWKDQEVCAGLMFSDRLDEVRSFLRNLGLAPFTRSCEDDTKILEIWM